MESKFPTAWNPLSLHQGQTQRHISTLTFQASFKKSPAIETKNIIQWISFYFQFKSKQANSWYSLPYYFVALSRLVISILVCKKVLKPFTEVSNTHYLGELNIFKLVQIKYGTVAVWNWQDPCAQTVSFSYFISLRINHGEQTGCNFTGLVSAALCRLGFICPYQVYDRDSSLLIQILEPLQGKSRECHLGLM